MWLWKLWQWRMIVAKWREQWEWRTLHMTNMYSCGIRIIAGYRILIGHVFIKWFEFFSYYWFILKCINFQGPAGEQYDRFAFDIDLPRDDDAHKCIEFCICFKINSSALEFWDNNHGLNYSLISHKSNQQIDAKYADDMKRWSSNDDTNLCTFY